MERTRDKRHEADWMTQYDRPPVDRRAHPHDEVVTRLHQCSRCMRRELKRGWLEPRRRPHCGCGGILMPVPEYGAAWTAGGTTSKTRKYL